MSGVTLTDRSDDAIKAMSEAVEAALEAMGQQGTTYAKQNVEKAGRTGTTGALANQINHLAVLSENAVYIGTNLHYAIYHELGTGVYAEGGTGRKGWWVYVPGSSGNKAANPKEYTKEEAARVVAILREQGVNAHMTQGIRPIHFLKNAIADNREKLLKIAAEIIKKRMT